MMARWRLRLVWAVILALCTVWGVSAYLSSLRDTEPVLVAAREIPARAEITADMLTVVHVSRKDRAQLARDAFGSKDEVVGQYARRRIEAGEVLRNYPADITDSSNRFVSVSGEMPLTHTLPPDTRAFTVKVDRQAVMGNHVRVGDRVDIIFVSKADATGGIYSSLLIQRVIVLDVQRPPADSHQDDVLVTFLVTPEQAVDLALANRTGTLDLSLHPPDPGELIGPRTTSPLQFINGVQPAPAKPGVPQSEQQASTGSSGQ